MESFYLLEKWILIFGGYQTAGIVESRSTKIINLQTGQTCSLADLPINVLNPVGTNYKGVPVFCGGFNSSGDSNYGCIRYSQDSWIKVS